MLPLPKFILKRRLLFQNRNWVLLPSHKSETYSTEAQSKHKSISDALKVSAKWNLFRNGQNLHAHIIKLGYHDMLSLQNQLLNVYVICKRVPDACKLFDEMLVRNVITWNTIICGLSDNGSDSESNFYLGFQFFKRMLMGIARPDWITFTGLLRLCVDVNETVTSRLLHSYMVKLGFCEDYFVSGALVDTYGKLSLAGEARHVFDCVLERDLVLWNVMISCYAFNGFREEAVRLYSLMRVEGFKGDEFTFTSLLNSCASFGFCELGSGVHAIVIKLCFNVDIVVASSLVDMYAKNEKFVEARKAFDMMTFRNVVCWTTIIVGYGQHGNGTEAIKLLIQMLREDFHPEELTLASVLSSSGNLALVDEIRQVHAFAVKKGFSAFLSIANAMINAYFKSGCITCASQIFSSILKPDLFSWTSIIGAYAFHGFPNEATNLFERMLSDGVKPDQIAFLQVLSACSHGGFVNEGLHYFRLMVDTYKIVPNSEHHACLVDLLGRVGLLWEAFNVLTAIPIEPRCDALGAFLGACKGHGNIRSAKWAAEKLFTLEPNKPVNYLLMSNMYASTACWFDVASVRRTMRESCYNKAPGCSWMHIGGKVSSFLSGDKSHPQAAKVYDLLDLLHNLMKKEEN